MDIKENSMDIKENSMDIKEIRYKDKLLAMFFSKSLSAEGGIKFLTPIDFPLQVGLLEHKEGKKVPPHIHRDLHYDVNTTQEFIYIEKGKDVEVTIFSNDWEEVERLSLSAGDSIFFVSGGHSLDIPAGCRLFEIKQGPYPGDKEAKIFKP